MDEVLFSYIVMSLCENFPALSPFTMYRERFHDVIVLFEDMKNDWERRAMIKANSGKPVPEGSFMLNGTLYKPAQNDDWM